MSPEGHAHWRLAAVPRFDLLVPPAASDVCPFWTSCAACSAEALQRRCQRSLLAAHVPQARWRRLLL